MTALPVPRPGAPANILGTVLALLLSLNCALAQEAGVIAETPAPASVIPESPAQADGTEQVLAGEDTDAGAESPPAYVPRRTLAQDYLDAIDRVEAEYGPYATELSDLYLGLGQTYLENGEFEEARDAFHRGVMAVRVNSGPNSPEQTNHLYLIANIELLLGNSAQADQVIHNIYFINSEFYGEDSLELLPVLERIYAWRMLTWPMPPDRPRFADYEKIQELMKRIVEINEANYGENSLETARAYRRLGDAEFQIARYQMSEELIAAVVSEIQEVRIGIGESTPGSDRFDAGRRAYRKCVNAMLANEATPPLEYAEVLANQADWYLLFGRPARARKLYENAWQALAQNGEQTQLADGVLGQPRPMHFVEPAPGYLEDLPPDVDGLDLNISMTVTRSGDVRYVEVRDPPELLSKEHLSDIERQVREMPFRPAIKGGEVVTTEDFIWHFAVAPTVAPS